MTRTLRGVLRQDSPFAGFETFEACVIHQREGGHDEESARKICGSLQAKAEKGKHMDSGTVQKDVLRHDFVDLQPAVWTDEGYLRFEGFIAKPGIMEYPEYPKADGSPLRVLVPRDTLHSRASLDTLTLKPLTFHHPDPVLHPDQVTPYNEGELSIGSTGEKVSIRGDGRVSFSAVVRKADAIGAVKRLGAEGKILGLSPGYHCDEDHTPGVDPEFGAYDAIQTGRRYNHLAITPSPRGGPSVHFRIDSASKEPTREGGGKGGGAGSISTKGLDGTGSTRHDGADSQEISMKTALIEALVALGMKRADAVALVEKDEKKITDEIESRVVAQAKARMDEIEAAKVAATDAAKPKEPTADEIEAAKVARVAQRKARRTLDEIAIGLKLDADAHDDEPLRREILKAAGVEIPKMDGVSESVVTSIYFDAFLKGRERGRTDAKDVKLDPIRDAFRFDGVPVQRDDADCDLNSVYDSKPPKTEGK